MYKSLLILLLFAICYYPICVVMGLIEFVKANNAGGRRMTRLEENGMIIGEMTKALQHAPTDSYEEKVAFHLFIIATMIADISKSLAIIADKAESEVRNEQ